jgi:uncharacterized membrane protein YoaK (UPF0700 family)
VATDTDRSKRTGVAVLAVLLAACAGSVDVFAFFGSKNTLRTGIRQTAALLAGATISGVVLFKLRSAAPGVPVVLLAAAIAVHLHHVRNRLNASDGS